MSHFSKTFKTLRQQQGLTQQELADRLNVSKSRVNMYERGEREPNFDMLKSIGEFFNVDMNTLLGPVDVSESAKSNSALLNNMKAEISRMNLSEPALIHAIAVYSGNNMGIQLPSNLAEKALVDKHGTFFTKLPLLKEKELANLLSFASTMTSAAKDSAVLEDKAPPLLDAAHEIEGASPEDKLDDDKYFDL